MAKRFYDDIKRHSTDCVRSDNEFKKIKEIITPNSALKKTTLLDLNVDCLLAIFNKLSLGDRLRCTLASQRLHNLYVAEIAPSYKKITTEDLKTVSKIKPADLRNFLKPTAEFIREVDFACTQDYTDILVPIFRYGVNIKEVNMVGTENRLTIILAYAHSVEKLDASCCQLADNKITEIHQLANLKVLRLEKNDLTGKYLSSLSNLEELHLYANPLVAEHVQEIARGCPKLRVLDISGCCPMDTATCEVIAQHCQSLEAICLKGSHKDFTALTKLPHLRKLGIKDAQLPLLNAFAEHRAEQLEEIRIWDCSSCISSLKAITQFKNLKIFCYQAGGDFERRGRVDLGSSVNMLGALKKLEKLVIIQSTSVNRSALLDVVRACPNLNYMAWLWASFVPAIFIFQVIELLQERRAVLGTQNTTCKPFVLVVHGANLQDSIFKDKRYLEASSIFKLHILRRFALGRYFYYQDDFPYDH